MVSRHMRCYLLLQVRKALGRQHVPHRTDLGLLMVVRRHKGMHILSEVSIELNSRLDEPHLSRLDLLDAQLANNDS